MSLELCPLLRSDVETMERLIWHAFADSPVLAVMAPHGVTPTMISSMAERDLKTWGQDPHTRLMKIVDTRTGEMISHACWEIFTEERPEEEYMKRPDFTRGEGWDQAWLDTFLLKAFNKRNETMGGKPYIHLALLVTSPSHRKRGAASLLLQWGLEQSKNLKLPIFLGATPEGLPLYLSLGFQKVGEIIFPLTSTSNRVNTLMIRPAPETIDAAPETTAIMPVTAPSDFLALAEVEAQAFTLDLVMTLAFPKTMGTKASSQADAIRTRAEELRSLSKIPTTRFMIAVDTTSDKIVAWSRWHFFLDPSDSRDPFPIDYSVDANIPLLQHLSGALDNARNSHFNDGRPYCFVGILCTLPAYQAKGIGSQLLKWGLDIADEKGLECWINASPVGLSLYKRLGWEEIGSVDVHLGDWGGEHGVSDRTVYLIRKPREKAES